MVDGLSASPGRSPAHGRFHYRIVVLGALDPDWAERLGLSRTVREHEQGGTVTEFAGPLPDQAALMGVLQRLYAYGAELVAFERRPRIRSGPAEGLAP